MDRLQMSPVRMNSHCNQNNHFTSLPSPPPSVPLPPVPSQLPHISIPPVSTPARASSLTGAGSSARTCPQTTWLSPPSPPFSEIPYLPMLADTAEDALSYVRDHYSVLERIVSALTPHTVDVPAAETALRATEMLRDDVAGLRDLLDPVADLLTDSTKAAMGLAFERVQRAVESEFLTSVKRQVVSWESTRQWSDGFEAASSSGTGEAQFDDRPVSECWLERTVMPAQILLRWNDLIEATSGAPKRPIRRDVVNLDEEIDDRPLSALQPKERARAISDPAGPILGAVCGLIDPYFSGRPTVASAAHLPSFSAIGAGSSRSSHRRHRSQGFPCTSLLCCVAPEIQRGIGYVCTCPRASSSSSSSSSSWHSDRSGRSGRSGGSSGAGSRGAKERKFKSWDSAPPSAAAAVAKSTDVVAEAGVGAGAEVAANSTIQNSKSREYQWAMLVEGRKEESKWKRRVRLGVMLSTGGGGGAGGSNKKKDKSGAKKGYVDNYQKLLNEQDGSD